MMENNGKIDKAIHFLSQYLHGKERALELALTCFFSRGHLLIEDLPGLGKTTLAIAIAKVLGLTFGRIQCTSDLLPSDITGVSIFDKNTGAFIFQPGPIFNHIVLVDEINRATPKTQSALLEAMGEKQVTIEGRTYDLPRPFLVIATQNPTEQFGTFPLPESQMDRFMMKISIGYPPREAEREILRGGSKRRAIQALEPMMGKQEVMEIQDRIRTGVYLSEKVLDYLLNIIEATRANEYLLSGLSTRGALALVNTAKSSAFFSGKDYVVPENIKRVAEYVIPHRVLFREEYESVNKKEIIKSILEEVPVPA
ncbi:AAA family ATPase [Syntrophobacter fumaroxidans]|uniref:ATPase associated with various cellular activities, AAA_3 n=1 Tax=Syntrophobacter fumaroxidans (strain DSM 10017 / MPOB) TaxID=335543 RepID=A0LNE8_SYNFM|nr:MoxR family ATPase [Syntrophobacter fumaroxidans]ABK18950.1 ATPase associated with various cellular activities, AAA_3 [Syntrophobacter fumaroxidans MPOB]